MKHLLFKILVASTVLLGAFAGKASADTGYEWTTVPNHILRAQLIGQLRDVQGNLVGDPVYFMIQDLMLQIEAAAAGDQYIWVDQALRACLILEDMFPPVVSHPAMFMKDKLSIIRNQILLIKDYPMHETHLADEPADAGVNPTQTAAFLKYNSNFLNYKRQNALDALKTRLQPGECQVIKIYSSGFIFRTTDKTVGVDICYQEGFGTTAGLDDIASAIDILFLTHAHGDHYDKDLWRKMENKSKPIVTPWNILQDNNPNVHVLMKTAAGGHLHSGSTYYDTLGEVFDTQIGPSKITGIKSEQGDVACIVYLAETSGWRFIHTGDNSNVNVQKGFEGKYEAPDIVIDPIFQGIATLLGNVKNMLHKSQKPSFYINAHENEFHHTSDHRVSYRFMFKDKGALGGSPASIASCVLLMDNGESAIFRK